MLLPHPVAFFAYSTLRRGIMKRLAYLAVAGLLLGGSGQAKANLIRTLDPRAIFIGGPALRGTGTVQVSAGVAPAVDLVIGPPDSLAFNSILEQFPFGFDFVIVVGTIPSANLELRGTSSLVNYHG